MTLRNETLVEYIARQRWLLVCALHRAKLNKRKIDIFTLPKRA